MNTVLFLLCPLAGTIVLESLTAFVLNNVRMQFIIR